MTAPRLILASSSEPRKKLLQRFHMPFEYISPDIDETPLPNENPEEMVVRLAKEKASVFAERYPHSFIIGADQVGVLNSTILGKPLTEERAIEQLSMMSGKTVRFLVGLCLLDTKNNTHQISLETCDVVFRNLSLKTIKQYLQKESAYQCAGSLKIEGLGIALVDKLHGDDYTVLIGLPMIKLSKMLENVGMNVI